MKFFKINNHISMILILSSVALVLAGTAAFYSVYGLSKLFDAGLSTIVFFSTLELAKLVLVSYVYQYWKIGNQYLKKYFTAAIVVISLLTSLGVYSYLLNSHQKTSNKIDIRNSKIKLIDTKKTYFLTDITRYQDQIKSKNERIGTLTNTRKQQENRLDTLYNRRLTTVAKRTEDIVKSSNEEITINNKEISEIMNKINSLNDSVQSCDMKIMELKNSDVSVEVGTFQQLSDITGVSMETLVKILGFLIIFVFDPLAVGLVIGANDTWAIYIRERDEKKKKKEEEEKKNSTLDITSGIIQSSVGRITPEYKKPEPKVEIPVESKPIEEIVSEEVVEEESIIVPEVQEEVVVEAEPIEEVVISDEVTEESPIEILEKPKKWKDIIKWAGRHKKPFTQRVEDTSEDEETTV